MTRKEKCDLLRQIRRELAETNGIRLPASECFYEGSDCTGVCPKCDKEIRILEAELSNKSVAGVSITLAALSPDFYPDFGEEPAEGTDEEENSITGTLFYEDPGEENRKIYEGFLTVFDPFAHDITNSSLTPGKDEIPADKPFPLPDFTPESVLASGIYELDLTVRSYNCLRRAGILTIGDLVSRTWDEVIGIRNLTPRCFDEILAKLSALGLSLKPSEDD